jgi:hypothetical protein
MRVASIEIGLGSAHRVGSAAVPEAERRAARVAARSREARQLSRMIAAGFILFLVPAAVGAITGWRWSPWPAGPEGRRSVVGEARAAAEAYVPLGFMGW